MAAKLPLRPNVCLLIFNNERRLFLGERAGEPGVWQLPQGGVEPELSEEENALKEAHEELGVDAALLRSVKKLKARHQYEWHPIPERHRGKWRGQKQTFWLIEFLGCDADIRLDRFEPEFMSWCWCSAEEVRRLAEPKRLPGYVAPLAEFDAFLAALCNL